MNSKKKKVCLAASSGGHFEQLMMLEKIMLDYDCFVLTEKTSYNTKSNGQKFYYTLQVNRKEKLFLLKMVWIALQSLIVFAKERPDVVICTGVLAMIPMCMYAKIFGKKLIYIESFAKITSPTETGKLLYKFADQFYVQWESMKEIYPNAICLGGIY
ncbi:MAG: PssD/Cps14F family polysaccharide biosynthesis glycosyltransferase [Clostridia bacterium]